MKVSYSKLSTFIACQKKYYFSYVDKIEEEAMPEALVVGIAVHNFIEEFSKLHVLETDSAPNINSLIEKYTREIKIKVKKENQEQYAHLAKVYTQSRKVLKPLVSGNTIFTERFFNEKLGEHSISGKIDVITENMSIVDYKTASKMFKQAEIEDPMSDKGLQLTVYCIPFLTWFSEVPKKVGYQIILKKSCLVQNIATSRTLEQIDQTKEYLYDKTCQLDYAVRNNEFHMPDNDKPCYWCQYKERCINT